jgi:uncharacterized protein (DUF433 family)
MTDYVDRRETGFYVSGTRVPLDCIVREYRNGESAEIIRSHFPALRLEQVYGAITFYLAHVDEVERVLEEHERIEDGFRDAHPAPAHLKEKLEGARQQLPVDRDR